MKAEIRHVIIEWLGGAYDAEDKYPGNPDYRNAENVDKLVEALSRVMSKEQIED